MTKLSSMNKDFTEGLSGWYSGGKLPPRCGRDVGILLELQKKRLDSCGICAERITVSRPMFVEPICFKSQSGSFNANIVDDDFRIVTRYRSSSGKLLYSHAENTTVMLNVLTLKGGALPENTPIKCPRCGAVAKLNEYREGCRSCGTRFRMSELYPVVTGWHETPDYSKRGKELRREILSFVIAGTLLLGILGGIKAFPDISPALLIGYCAAGAIAGYAAWALFMMLSLLSGLRILFTGLLRCVGTDKKLESFLKPLDSNFFYRGFEDKAFSLFRMMAYSDDASELPVWTGEGAPEKTDLIDSRYLGMALRDISCDNSGIVNVTLEMLTRGLHFRNGSIRRKRDRYILGLRKDVSRPTEPGFTLSAVNCPCCGGSFDAYREKLCPFCSAEYPAMNDDWTVTAFRRIK